MTLDALDPLAEHERWLGLPLANALALGRRTHGAPGIELEAHDAPWCAPTATVRFTQNHAVGDPGSALFPFHLLNLPPASRAHLDALPDGHAMAFGARENWRGVARLRLAPRRLLTFTTLAGLDNRTMLPPTSPLRRNEDLLLGGVAQLVHPASWFADLPFGLPHRRATSKRWATPSEPFAQEPLHFLLDTLESRGCDIASTDPRARLAWLAAVLADVAATPEPVLQDALAAHAIDVASRVLFAIATDLDDASVSAARKAALAGWRTSPALAVDGPALQARLADPREVRDLARGYAEALGAWPALWDCARGMA